MAEQEERQKKAALLLEIREKKQELALMQKEARDIAEQFEELAKMLRQDPARIDNPDPPALPSGKSLYDLGRKIRDAQIKLAELRSTATQAGLRLPTVGGTQ